ncbi:MAG: single-stranded-DNA-specific exonuclease RecJ, partial [Armatimonadetes bacterium]|nr:single-stranded-DNA-specific exonuclease RecJ [Armatimonadota bacterium]
MRPEPLTQWKILGQIDSESRTLAESLNLSPVTARLLRNRGLTEVEAVRKFMTPSLGDFHDPHLMKDMDRAVERLERAVRKNEKILIHGDYDVDGICATAMMV